MPGTPAKRCLVVIDAVDGVHQCELTLPADASIAAALAAARLRLAAVAVDWECAVTGIYGCVRPRDFRFADGDRIELYRPLPVDPKVRRRERSRARERAAAPGRRR